MQESERLTSNNGDTSGQIWYLVDTELRFGREALGEERVQKPADEQTHSIRNARCFARMLELATNR